MPKLMIEAARLDAERLASEWMDSVYAESYPEFYAAFGAVGKELIRASSLYVLRLLADPSVGGSAEMLTAITALRSQLAGSTP